MVRKERWLPQEKNKEQKNDGKEYVQSAISTVRLGKYYNNKNLSSSFAMIRFSVFIFTVMIILFLFKVETGYFSR